MKNLTYFILVCFIPLLSACGSRETVYEGIRFPETSATEITFQEHNIPANCSAFAHLLMNTKMNSNGQDIAEAMRKEAREKGANLVLIGRARVMAEAELEANQFDYYGPEYTYTFNKTWLGWKFGFNEWSNAGSLLGVGVESWGNASVVIDHSLLIQAVFLRCEEKP